MVAAGGGADLPKLENRLEVGAGAEDDGAAVVGALSCGLLILNKVLDDGVAVGAVVPEVAVGWLSKEKPLVAVEGDDTVGAEKAGADVLAKLKEGAVDVPPNNGPLVEGAVEVLAGGRPPSWNGLLFLSAPESCGLLRLAKRPPACWAPPLLPKASLLALELVSNRLAGAADVVGAEGNELLAGCDALLNKEGAAEEVAGFPNRLSD